MNNTIRAITNWNNLLTETLNYNGGQVSHKMARRMDKNTSAGKAANIMQRNGFLAGAELNLARKAKHKQHVDEEKLRRHNIKTLGGLLGGEEAKRTKNSIQSDLIKHKGQADTSKKYFKIDVEKGKKAKELNNR